MASHRVSFQLQNKGATLSEQYNNGTPCSKRDARYNLDLLERQGLREFSSQSDKRKLEQAIREAKSWVDRSNNMDSSTQSTTVAKFESDEGARCRIDIHIHSGSGHFSN